MKKSAILLMFICIVILGFTASVPKKKNDIVGKWQSVSCKINGQIIPGFKASRIQYFRSDESFESKIIVNSTTYQKFNKGKYFRPNDTLMVTIHTYENGKFSPFAFYYTVKIKDDSLHFYGYYLVSDRTNQRLLRPEYTDEWWLRIGPESAK
jgi:hypothetical protein